MQLARTTNDLGITSATGKECMRVLHDCFEKACISHGEAERQFRRWHDGFIKFHGNLLERETIKADFDGIASRLLGRKQSVDPARFLFILYTYHALVIKIIAANVVLRVQDAKPEIRIRNRLSPNSVDEFLHSIENNEFYKDSAGIINFLGDFCFSWYLNVLDNESKTAMQRLVTDVNQLAANSMEKRETTACEILRTLHQAIIPRKIRHDLGEYYTPSWLARLVIEESGYSGDMSQNVLDPGCGSGTFLLELIALMRSAGSTKHDARSLLDAILTRIKGFDVNPIAVLAAKTSFLIGIQELIPGCSVPFEIPVFLVDSMIGTPAALKQLNVLEEVDLVVGNPPWIKWEFLAVDYKASLATTVLNEYTLFNYSGMQAGLGFAHDDISIAFTYVCIDRYLKKGGVLAFVLKQTMYKGIAGKEFRKFTIEKNGESTPVQIIKVHDLRALKPFKSIADAETSIAIIKKGTATRYPVPYYSWQMNHGVHLHDSMALDAVKSLTTMKKYDAWPDLAMNDITAPWILADEGVSPPVIPKGKNCYIARHGVVNDLNSVFFIEITGVSSELASIRNLQLGKKQVRQIATTVEIAGIYPVIKPRHVKKWRIKGYYFMIVPHAKHGQNNEMELREKMPKTYEYLEIFKADLEGRASKWFKGEGMPFYSLFGIGEYTFQPFKVVWSSIGALHAFAVASSIHDPRIGTRLVIPDNTIGYLSFDTSDEAHYACAILNASAIKEMFAAHSTGSKWGISIAMVNDLPIPRFDPDNPVHVRLCRLSKEAHDRTAKNESIAELERELDVLVSGLFSTIQREK